jgi:hypothetical protein
MLAKSLPRARTLLLTLLLTSCRTAMPWRDAPPATEVNVAFTMSNNLLFLTDVTVDGHRGHFILGTATARSVIDPRVARAVGSHAAHTFNFNEKHAVRFSPVTLDLGPVADAIVGADVAGSNAVTIDYRSGLVTFQEEGIHPEGMELFRFDREPAVNITIDGRSTGAIVDTSLPDTLVVPAAESGRMKAHVTIAGTDFGVIDVAGANVTRPRIGNRLLSKFLITIDYGRHVTGLWRDPRIP